MSLQEEVEALSKVPIFERLDMAKLKVLAFTADRATYAPQDLLCKEGERGDRAFVLMSGEAKIWVETNTGPLHVADLKRHDVVGEIALLAGLPRSATVIAESQVEALILNEDVFMHMIHEFPSVGLELMRSLAEKLHNTTSRLQDVANLPSDE
ncbi:Crp/Fnr family transcriptional regulator [Curvivirga sp.]|uniref:Crp/Fnr family transcriptional regulator n=1 Tax=Curvivirga sp. TaxID=2856848 RepID=UPI003B5AADBE